MKIMHIDFTGSYNDEMGYQMNHLSRQNIADGFETIIATTDIYLKEGIETSLELSEPQLYTNDFGVKVIRFPYHFVLSRFISKKFRKVKGLSLYLNEIRPDIILFHGLCAWELLTVAQYKRKHSSVKFYADSHEDFNNSARNCLSKNILHRLFYRTILRKAYPQIEKIFYISLETKDFINQLYGLPDDKLEFYPLGGVIFDEAARNHARQKVREQLGLCSNDTLVMHSGKMVKLKRTEELLHAFSCVQNPLYKLIIIGSIPDDMKPILLPLMEADKRVEFLGWRNSDELMEYLCACDLYLQPGSQSATMQNAVCCGAPVMLYPHKSYLPFLKGNGWFVESVDDMKKVLLTVSENPHILVQMRINSLQVAWKLFDYRNLAARLYI